MLPCMLEAMTHSLVFEARSLRSCAVGRQGTRTQRHWKPSFVVCVRSESRNTKLARSVKAYPGFKTTRPEVDLAPKTEERFRFLEEAAAVADDDQDAEEDEDSPEEDEQPVTKMQAEPTEVEEEPEESHLIGILRPKRPRKKLHKRMVPKPSLLKRNRPLQRSSLQSLLSIPDPEQEVDPVIFPEIEPESEVDGSGRSSSDVAPHTSVKRIVPKPSMLRRNRPLQDSVQGRTSPRRMRFGLSSSLR